MRIGCKIREKITRQTLRYTQEIPQYIQEASDLREYNPGWSLLECPEGLQGRWLSVADGPSLPQDLLMHETRRESQPRRLHWQVAAWLAFCVAAVAIRGVRWDEACERAQVLLGIIKYPEGHPLAVYARSAFGIHYEAAAALLRVTKGPFALCAIRNVLAAAATVIPVFLITARLSGRALLGHAAAVLALLGAYTQFDSYYPLFIWPDMFTSGHIGLAYALLVLYCIAWSHWRSGLFLLGIMPLIHIGQMPVLLVTAAAACVCAARHGQAKAVGRAIPWGVAGLVLTGLWALHWHAGLPVLPESGAYASGANPQEVWARYTRYTDVHRAYPRYGEFAWSHIALGALLLLGAAAARLEARRAPGPALVLWVYAAGCALAVWGTSLFLALYPGDPPYLLVAWMPYRMANHAAVLLLVTAVALLRPRFADSAMRLRGAWLLLAGIAAFATLRWLARFALPLDYYGRYAAPTEMLFFLLLGAAWGCAFRALGAVPRFRWLWLAASIAALGGLAAWHQTGAAYVGVGAMGAFIARWTGPFAARAAKRGAVALFLLGLTLLMLREYVARKPLRQSSLGREVSGYLAAIGDGDAMIAAPHYDINLQENTGHPILVTYETHQFIPYVPKLAPVIERIYRDVYGLRFDGPWHYELGAWESRTREEWTELGGRYGFKYVLAPQDLPLDLDTILREKGYALYHVPPAR